MLKINSALLVFDLNKNVVDFEISNEAAILIKDNNATRKSISNTTKAFSEICEDFMPYDLFILTMRILYNRPIDTLEKTTEAPLLSSRDSRSHNDYDKNDKVTSCQLPCLRQ